MLVFLDGFFLIFHTLWTLFNLVGWIFVVTRKIHRLTLLLTAASWGILGIWHGFGYCVCTDWHWQILERLGKTDLPYSYITYLVFRITGIRIQDESWVIGVTLAAFLGVVLVMSGLWIREIIKKSKAEKDILRGEKE